MTLWQFFLSFIVLCLMGCSTAGPRKPAVPGFDPELSNFEYPFAVQFAELSSQGQKLKMASIYEKPQNPNGRTVLLLHGKNFASWYWERTVRELLLRGYAVLAVDQIGFGKSSKPRQYQFSFQALAANTNEILKSLGLEKVDVIGHSMGGMLATRFALMYPEKTRKLVLVNPIGLEDWKLMVPYRTIDELYASELKQTPETIREYQRQAYFAGQWKPEYEPLIQVASGWSQHPDYKEVAWNAALTSDMVFTQPVIYEFPRLLTETLLIIGTRDRTAIGRDRVPESVAKKLGNYEVLGKQAARAIPRAKLVEIKGVGHMPQVEAFDQYFSALEKFLSSK